MKNRKEPPYYYPEDTFEVNSQSIGLSVLDFWKYAYSDLNSDPRDVIAEFLVSNALGLKEATNRQDWTPYDIDYKGIRVEVKSTGYYQTWRGEGEISTQRTYSVRKATDKNTGIYERHNDLYVFCLLNGKTREEANPLVLENWEFYVVPTSVINKECGENKTISLSRIRNMGYEKLPYTALGESIRSVAGCVNMRKSLHKLKRAQVQFICNECAISKEELFAMDEDSLYDVVYEKMCDIEIDEVCRNEDEKDSIRCEVASDIVTIMGNALAAIMRDPQE